MQNDRHIEIKRKPDLAEVVKSLRSSGRHDVADMISNIIGPLKQQQCVGKGKFAYLYVNNAQTSMDDQSKAIHGFINVLKKTMPRSINSILESMTLIPVVLPKNIVVVSMRIPLEVYQTSMLPGLLEKHPFMAAYLRKPRKDTQHLAKSTETQHTD